MTQPTEKEFIALEQNPTLAFMFADLAKVYAALWAASQDKKEREYLWFKQAAIDEIRAEIHNAGTGRK